LIIHTFLEQVFRKMFRNLLGYTIGKAHASLRDSTQFTRQFLLVRGWGIGTGLSPSPFLI